MNNEETIHEHGSIIPAASMLHELQEKQYRIIEDKLDKVNQRRRLISVSTDAYFLKKKLIGLINKVGEFYYDGYKVVIRSIKMSDPDVTIYKNEF